MNIVKELPTISLPITEPEYRARPELSYSNLSSYESLGFEGLDHLFDRKESPSLTLGSIVDTLITGSGAEFNAHYYVADFQTLGEKETLVANYLFEHYGSDYISVSLIPFQSILEAANTYEFQRNWKDDTRVKVITERCSYYYGIKANAKDKTIVDRKTFEDALEMVRALRESPATSGYFAENEPMFSPIRRYYQLKFAANLEGVDYRCMMDEVIVNYEDKTIIPIDLKTSSKAEWNFEDSFIQWKYSIQARLYAAILKANLEKDPYFKDFKMENYRFIVVNRKTLTPLVWEFPHTYYRGPLVDKNGNEWRDPRDIGKELRKYLDCRPQVPDSIVQDGLNIIRCLNPK